ncbi:SDR family oxidoreductase [Frigidibacter sp. ROC022]|uniref:SDR family oxidoreductase n=1 Tax=Frigidibacter sp. ROC022 TaxID=2971796 RepID=UPI00215A7E9C|nr:SDR family oxidoreductase [Frigidibacter sp. ROC022]MCR8724548.1 SDR family oxidoreductase [Frigidibacter sp. ROC022]
MSGDIRLDGRTALVTGAGRGLGAAMALALVRAGAEVTIADINEQAVREQERAAAALQPASAVRGLVGDLRDRDFCRAAVLASGGPDILVNNAALLPSFAHPGRLLEGGRFNRFWELDDSVVEAVLDVNFLAADRMARLSAPRMIEKGWGRIVNVGTRLTTMHNPGASPYGPSKAALEMASEIWVKDLAGTGVTVNLLSPGAAADTPGFATDAEKANRSRDPNFHMMAPRKMAAPIVWLASDRSNGFNGHAIEADGWDETRPPDEEALRIARPLGFKFHTGSGIR